MDLKLSEYNLHNICIDVFQMFMFSINLKKYNTKKSFQNKTPVFVFISASSKTWSYF